MKDVTTISLSKSIVQTIVEKHLEHEHSELLAKVIIDNLSTSERGMENILLAFQGVVTTLENYGLTIGSIVSVKPGHLNNWKFDEPAMVKAQIILNNSIECKVIAYDNTKKNCIKVNYTYLAEGNSERKVDEDDIKPEMIIK